MEYSIHELSKIAKISTRTLRYYHEIDLLKPKRINSSGYRIYGEDEVDKLQQILFYKSMGFKLEDIKNIVKLPDIYKQLKAYFNNTVIITLEAAGSFTEINGECKIVPSVRVVAKDSTGAGDIFHGAITYFLGQGYDLEKAIHYSSVTSAISVTRIGSRYSIPDLEEVMNYDELI